MGAALRPAFSPETSSLVTAAACEVCSTWIGSNVARDLNDLRRVHQLLVSSLGKLQIKTNTTQLYNESLATLEKLAILKAWAEVYVVAMIGNGSAPGSVKQLTTSNKNNDEEFGDFEYRGESLLNLVQPELVSLAKHWLAALKDHALLSLPPEFSSQLPHDGGAFYTTDTMDSSRSHYSASWPPILHAAALWLNAGGFESTQIDNDNSKNMNDNTNNNVNDPSSDRFHLLFGICMEALCSTRSIEPLESIITCLQALFTLLDSSCAREFLIVNRSLAIELCNVLHRLLLTRDDRIIHLLCMEILKQVIKSAQEKMDKSSTDSTEADALGEGGENGVITPGKSLVFAVLEVCLCLLVRQLPALSPSPNATIITALRLSQSFEDSGHLIAIALSSMETLHKLCSPNGMYRSFLGGSRLLLVLRG